jgi:hypothetical protein
MSDSKGSKTTFYLKMQGRVIGPFTVDALHQMVKSGQVSRVHMMSEDKQNWFRASELPELFEAATGSRGFKGPSESVSAATNVSASSTASQVDRNDSANTAATVPAQAIWYYTLEGQQAGPVELGQLARMISKAKLKSSDLVWKESWPDWQSIADVPELDCLVPESINIVRNRGSSRREGQDSVAENEHELTEIAQTIRLGNPWAFFICIVFYIFSAFTIVSGIAQLAVGARFGLGIGTGSLTMIWGGVFLTGTIFLNHHVNWASRYVSSLRLPDLNRALIWLRRLSLLVAICLIFILVFVSVVLIAILSGISLFNSSEFA